MYKQTVQQTYTYKLVCSGTRWMCTDNRINQNMRGPPFLSLAIADAVDYKIIP